MNGDGLVKAKIDRFSIFLQSNKIGVSLLKNSPMENYLSPVFNMHDNFLADDLVDDHRIYAGYHPELLLRLKLTKSQHSLGLLPPQ